MRRTSIEVVLHEQVREGSKGVTRSDALTMLAEYEQYVPPIRGMRARFPEDGSERKAMRWLGYAQGVASALDIYTVDELREHSRNGVVSPPTSEANKFVREKRRTMFGIVAAEVTTWLSGFMAAFGAALLALRGDGFTAVLLVWMVLLPWARAYLRIRGKQ